MRTLSAAFHLFPVNTFSAFSMNHFSLCVHSNASLHGRQCSLTMRNVLWYDDGKLATRCAVLFLQGQPTYAKHISQKVYIIVLLQGCTNYREKMYTLFGIQFLYPSCISLCIYFPLPLLLLLTHFQFLPLSFSVCDLLPFFQFHIALSVQLFSLSLYTSFIHLFCTFHGSYCFLHQVCYLFNTGQITISIIFFIEDIPLC